jgi:hypothetical protein
MVITAPEVDADDVDWPYGMLYAIVISMKVRGNGERKKSGLFF